jgi:glycosyltransferase involved in cell wall biosynthesis
LLRHKWDLAVLWRLTSLMKTRQIDALITVGAGDKMFWGRLAARWAGVPVVLCAIHSTGWPDRIEWLNRQLTPWTDFFIAVADSHGRFLVERERLPSPKVTVIANGVDVQRFRRLPEARAAVRARHGIAPEAPVAGVVAALRPEKNLAMFLRAAKRVQDQLPAAHFLLVGDGPERPQLEELARQAGLQQKAHFLGCRDDVPELLSAMDLFALTSDMEANPVSILEAMACELPVVATQVGSIAEAVQSGTTGLLTQPGETEDVVQAWLQLLPRRERSRQMGIRGREEVVARWSLEEMVAGYQRLIEAIYRQKSHSTATCPSPAKPGHQIV